MRIHPTERDRERERGRGGRFRMYPGRVGGAVERYRRTAVHIGRLLGDHPLRPVLRRWPAAAFRPSRREAHPARLNARQIPPDAARDIPPALARGTSRPTRCEASRPTRREAYLARLGARHFLPVLARGTSCPSWREALLARLDARAPRVAFFQNFILVRGRTQVTCVHAAKWLS